MVIVKNSKFQETSLEPLARHFPFRPHCIQQQQQQQKIKNVIKKPFYCWPLSSSDGGASLLTLYFLDISLLRWSSQRERMTATVVIESITTKDTTSPATTAETDEPLEEDSSPEAKDQRE